MVGVPAPFFFKSHLGKVLGPPEGIMTWFFVRGHFQPAVYGLSWGKAGRFRSPPPSRGPWFKKLWRWVSHVVVGKVRRAAGPGSPEPVGAARFWGLAWGEPRPQPVR